MFICALTAHKGLGITYFDMEEYKKSKKHFERAIALYNYSRIFPSWNCFFKLALERTKVLNNEKDIKLKEIFKYYDENKMKINEGRMLNCIGEIQLNVDDQHLSEAKNWIKKAIEANKRNGMIWHLAKDYALYAELFKRKGNLPKAKENLSKAIEIFKECGADGWVEKYEKELAAL
jgi:tetratricopeptide (TPR) repeat protein